RGATDMNEAAAHADRLAAERTSEPLARVAFDGERPPFHAGARERAGGAANGQSSARHQAAGLDAGLPFDPDRAFAQPKAYAIETRAAAFDQNCGGIALVNAEHISRREAHARRSHLDALDFRDRFAGESLRDKRLKIDALGRRLAQRKAHRAQRTRSLR